MKLILLGYMASGKTGVGKQLAQKLALPFLDLDSKISKAENKEIPEIFATKGEIHFRTLESGMLKDVLQSGPEDFILSVGGGTPCYGKNLQFMKECPDTILVYLKTSLQELTKRLLREKESRPLVSHLDTEEALEDFIRKHLFERAFYYNQSDLQVLTDGQSMEEIADEIIRKLE